MSEGILVFVLISLCAAILYAVFYMDSIEKRVTKLEMRAEVAPATRDRTLPKGTLFP